ncbi:MAG: ABC transporter permease [Marinovum algicola]|jgi:nitrate/nitrite transport system permease protein|uniref:Nitrate/nitrite transport system permease protein n=1 Tax=Marinovum algicola TaxID=42444 RepID=A0A975W710_9RHOB|nr:MULTISPECIES: ABC transporter permease [Marinovum]AKO96091.1 ABC-type nitrate transport system, permease component [Marinovum algicola DG 898]MDD9740050.1 ABC transporter permease [Marinovum sp. SP66]MDD9742859.1 ABC transporter permease [Marinovum sp. PR37]SEI64164.1 nitrate/nitrite transport system permease protein [Marinovum algicola]SLN24987.1 Bicarbonate transport system permease protein CmpB [Marinovum algicola]
MTTVDPEFSAAEAREARRAKLFTRINAADKWFQVLGLSWATPVLKAAAGDNPKAQVKEIWRLLAVPLIAIIAFLMLWATLAPKVQTSLGAVPGPAAVWEEAVNLHEDAAAKAVKREKFETMVAARNEKLVEAGRADEVKDIAYTGAPSYYQQIWTSIQTVFFGFLIATAVAVPLGIAAGLSPTANAAINPLVQIFKPVSPLAWLPIVTMIVSAVYATNDGMFSKSFLISAITVTLCSLWPTLINTALGVASIDKDLVNVSKVLKMNTYTKITKLVLPSALPLIFTGLRLSLGVGWMVLIAAEMLAQNPGLGKFVWDEFQNGSSSSLAKIMVAVLTIGVIGFLLDRVMFALQSLFTFSNNR